MRLLPIVALVLAACACGKGAEAPPPLAAAAAAAVPIENFAKVDDGLWRGAQPDDNGFRALAGLGVKTIVNLRSNHDDDRDDVPEGVAIEAIPLHALLDSDPPTDDEVKRFFDIVLDPARRPVFVHCAHGKDRTGTMCALYRMEIDGWSPKEAFDEMQKYGFHDMYEDLERFVLGYTPRGFAKRAR